MADSTPEGPDYWPSSWPAQGTKHHLPFIPLAAQKRENRNKRAKLKDRQFFIGGIDTETFKGKVRLVSYEYLHKGKSLTGSFEVNCFHDFVLGLMRTGSPSKNYSHWFTKDFFFYNLKYDHDAILKTLLVGSDASLMDSIYKAAFAGVYFDAKSLDLKDKTTQKEGHCVKVVCLYKKFFSIYPTGDGWKEETYQVFRSDGYHPKKWVTQKFGNKKLTTMKTWDIAQWFGGSLKSNAPLVGEKKGDFDLKALGYKNESEMWEDEDFWKENLDEIKKYALKDAEIAGKLARMVAKDLFSIGARFDNPYSKAKIAEQFLIDNGFKEVIHPLLSSPHARLFLEVANTAYHGGWFENSGIGWLNNVRSYDLVSAYPAVMTHLPSLAVGRELNGTIKHGHGAKGWNEYLNIFREENEMAFVEVSFKYTAGEWYPTCDFDAEICGLVSPRRIHKWMTVYEYLEAMKWPMDRQPIIQRWTYHKPKDKSSYPFRETLEILFGLKGKHEKGSREYMMAKILMNSLYGKTIQGRKVTYDHMGNLYNPAFAATITGFVRAQIAECIRYAQDAGGKVLEVATDGISIQGLPKGWVPPTTSLPNKGNLGNWEIDSEGPEILIMTGGVKSIGPLSDPNPPKGSIVTTTRGDTAYNALQTCGGGGVSSWLDLCIKHKDETSISGMTPERPKSGKMAIAHGKPEQTNEFLSNNWKLPCVPTSRKRLMPTSPTVFGDLASDWFARNPHETKW